MSNLHATILSLFPEMFPGPLQHSLAGKALGKHWSYEVVNIRDFGIVDQDKINIKINNNTESLVIIEDKPYYFKIDRDRRKNIIQIIGLENGEVPPITAQIIIESTSKKILHKINLKLLPKEVSKIELNF